MLCLEYEQNTEEKHINGKVIKGVGGVFDVMTDDGILTCVARKRIRHLDNEILIGDDVTVQKLTRARGAIEELLPRKNRMKRPFVANIDQVFIVTASMPPADFSLVDKILINCQMQNVSAKIVINKCEAASQHFFDRVKANYEGLVDDIIVVSAHKGTGIEALKEALSGKITCFTGQSGVGKTSLLNVILPEYKGEIGAISARIARGKNTTRHSQLFSFDTKSFVVDTPGFSLFDLEDVKASDLMLYYGEFTEFAPDCKYKMCTHISEPNCAVKKALDEGKICKERYERYVALVKELKEIEKTRY